MFCHFKDILNDKDCEELDPDSGSISGNPKKSYEKKPTSLNLNPVAGKIFFVLIEFHWETCRLLVRNSWARADKNWGKW